MNNNYLNTPIEYVKGIGPQRADALKLELKIFNLYDLLTHYPFRYVDRTKFYKINEITADLPYVQLRGFITRMETVGQKRAKRLVAKFMDDTGTIDLVWFQGIKWMQDKLVPGAEYIVFGKPTAYKNTFNLTHPETESVSEENTKLASALQAVYPSTEKLKAKGLDSKGLARTIKAALQNPLFIGSVTENLSSSVIALSKLIPRAEALKNIHLPDNADVLSKAEMRLKFEELFFVQLKLLRLNLYRKDHFKGFLFSSLGNYFNSFYNEHLPFPLTNAQKRVLKEIRQDTLSGRQMNRLLQGDVGSGKTVVALISMLIAIDNGYQTCLMAPTEILAQQHYAGISALIERMKINVGLLTGSTKAKERRALHEQLQNGELQLLIGTHALIEDAVQFQNLGMVVIDEQHRFGVEQRAKLWKKNIHPPHVLVMTATPIPRTLAMTLYGDLDISIMDELPPGRKPIQTQHMFDSHRERIFGFMKEQIALGRQVYVVYPLIKESEAMDYKDLEDGYESICRAFRLPHYKVSIVHGKMNTAAKDYEMQRFVKGETQIMVATTVIEVGVNVPNASVMVIESAERFGLAQLHQLRGRVGRGADQSYCMLVTGYKLSSDSRIRMETMVRTNDGFEIADVDLKLRGPGDLQGTQQSGVVDLKIADLAKDAKILHYARQIAMQVLQEDPQLQKPENTPIANYLAQAEVHKTNWSRIS